MSNSYYAHTWSRDTYLHYFLNTGVVIIRTHISLRVVLIIKYTQLLATESWIFLNSFSSSKREPEISFSCFNSFLVYCFNRDVTLL